MGKLFVLGFVWMMVELAVWISIAQVISGWWVFLWFIIACVIGIAIVRSSMKNLNPMAQQMQQGGFMQAHTRPPEGIMMKSIGLMVAGILLLIPGVLSDVLALLAILPPVQKKLKTYAEGYMLQNQTKMQDMMMKRMQDMGMDSSQFGQQFGGGGANPFGNSSFGGTTVDSSAKVVKNAKKIIHAANDDT